jgi:type VI secretion system protein ImpJ
VYEHGDLSTSFGKLDNMVREMLETAVPSNHVSLPLKRTEPTVFAAAIDQDRYFAAPQMFIAIKSSMKQDELIRRVPQILKVSSADQIERLIRRALPGVVLAHSPSPPSAIPIKSNYQYFQLDKRGEDWDAIRMSRHLAVYAPSDLADPEMELVILLPS